MSNYAGWKNNCWFGWRFVGPVLCTSLGFVFIKPYPYFNPFCTQLNWWFFLFSLPEDRSFFASPQLDEIIFLEHTKKPYLGRESAFCLKSSCFNITMCVSKWTLMSKEFSSGLTGQHYAGIFTHRTNVGPRFGVVLPETCKHFSKSVKKHFIEKQNLHQQHNNWNCFVFMTRRVRVQGCAKGRLRVKLSNMKSCIYSWFSSYSSSDLCTLWRGTLLKYVSICAAKTLSISLDS